VTVLGGDLNAGPQWDERQRYPSHAALFARIAAFGLADCLRVFHPEYVQTFRGHRGPQGVVPWELDHLFVTDRLRPRLRACDAVDDTAVHALSDHSPVVLDLDS
jgi:endonuclease/exonuclease/phosphatase family metal-dependent hydrolase